MNFGTPVPLLIGIVLIVGAIALFFLDKLKPGYGRDSDKIYAVLCLISGVFLLGHLTMELIPSFQQMIMTGMVIALLIDNIRSRGPASNRFAQQEGPDLRPDYRPPSRTPYGRRANVRAELDNDTGRYGPSRPVLGSREPGRPTYGDEGYGDRPYDERDRWDERRPEPRYGNNGGGRADERIRRRRPPLQLRGDIGTSAGNGYGGDDYGSAYPGNGEGGYSSHSGGGGYSSHSGGGGYGPAGYDDYGKSAPSDGGYYPPEGSEFPTTGGPSANGAERSRSQGGYPKADEYADYDRY